MPQIETVVFLMMENRSLDSVLGWLYDGTTKDYNGLKANTYFQPLQNGRIVQSYPVVPMPDNLGKYEYLIPYYDPTEAMYSITSWSGVQNQLFGNQNMITGMPPSNTPVTMQGFLQDYYRDGRDGFSGQDILWTYTIKQLTILHALAYYYGVSDAWFCSVPTQTNPNRAFSIIGTAQGRENDALDEAVEQFEANTIFNVLGTAGKSWGLYFSDIWSNNQSYTEYTFPWMTEKPSGTHVIGSHEDFYAAAKAGKLQNFTYLEPKWGWGTGVGIHQGTDYHPPTNVGPAELFLLKVLIALQASPQRDRMLFIITFDEHGGTYDHVKPPWGAINPDGMIGDYGFRFDQFGARVPTIFVSPYVARNTVFRAPLGSRFPFDHTSFIKTLLLWAGVDPNASNLGLGKRMPQAPTFDHVLSPTPVNGWTLDAELKVAPYEEGETVNDLFEGVGRAAVRKIMHTCKTKEEAAAEVEKYRADPKGYEEAMKASR